MKKLLSVILVAMVLLGYSVAAMAASVSSTVPLSLSITGQFGFTLDKYSYAFDAATSNLQTSIGIFCRSNNGKVWKMALNANEFTSGANTLPSNPNFKCAAWSNAGTEQAKGSFGDFGAEGGKVVPATQTDFYTSLPAEGSDPFVPLVLGLYVTVPGGQASGMYQTNLILTMYE